MTWTLGIHCGKHNSSICLLKNNNIELFIEEERLSRIKYDSEPIKCLELIPQFTTIVDNVLITHCQNSAYIQHLLRKNGVTIKGNLLVKNDIHHVCHAASAFYSSGFKEALCVVFDGRGSEFELSNGLNGAETTSIYTASYPANFEPIFKRLVIDPSRGTNFTEVQTAFTCSVVTSPNIDIGGMYQAVANLQGFGNLDCGKTMGLSAYGETDASLPSLLIGQNLEANANVFTNDNKINTRIYPELKTNDWGKKQANLAYAVQKATQEKALNYIKKAVKNRECKNIVISGGYALNIIANKYYKDYFAGYSIFVDPLSGDGGLSHGAAKLLYHTGSGEKKRNPLTTLYLGPSYSISKQTNRDVTPREVAQKLYEGFTVALYQGRSEAGARALGNRSILFNPCLTDGKEIINRIKKREYFRPFAGTILEHKVTEWFDIDSNPFMTFNATCKHKNAIPAITHYDNTCRIQTLTKEQNEAYYLIIQAFYELTNVPIVGNTSLNIDKQPIVETVDQAIEVLQTTEIDFLYIPETKDLISKQELSCTNQ